MNPLFRFADNTRKGSLANRLRRRRFALFRFLLRQMDSPVTVLDVGGDTRFWEAMAFGHEEGIEIVLLNLRPQETDGNLRAVVGDARAMPQYNTDEFDIVFSNSVIEHMGTITNQERMAEEIQRVGKRFVIQTPNFFFPLEPHFMFPGFQFLPRSVRVALTRAAPLGNFPRARSRAEAERYVDEIRLLKEGELRRLFPGGILYAERLFGLNKSLTVCGGFECHGIVSLPGMRQL